ncbi:D-amino acid dehydrogenase [Herbaspirillum sp. AP02]|uniref:D-amino acid dehydrogenase n=1 Tax=unclassified Herbaspirillum TaxID=2624150 RepID=UPI0015DB9081|nr:MULTISPECIES: D-amino acid dehydrogenase [unclassified Herbaspirillum]MBG7620379.1 D-amino acid dehydrogenase [Herbaspirillum sp. AP02]NZD67843.1 D-amino acid dehydrogenase [Herbaspirillum sp. AP21]
MKVVVIGGGIIGTATAYWLALQQVEVVLIEREPDVACQTSAGNAGVIAPGYVTPWAAPGMPTKILKYLFKAASPVVFRPRMSLRQWRWIGQWLGNCELERYRRNKLRMQRIAYYSRDCLHEFLERHPFDYGRSQGYLQLFRSRFDEQMAAPALALLQEAGVAHRQLTAAQCLAVEPGLRHARVQARSGLYLPDDEAGDCAAFARQLRHLCEEMGVQFRFDTVVSDIAVEAGQVRRLHLQARGLREQLDCDALVMAAGVDSHALLAPLGIRVPLYPVKGYSATIPILDTEAAPRAAVMDESFKTAMTRMDGVVRVAGTAELGDDGLQLRQACLHTLRQVMQDWFPRAGELGAARFWVGRRPMTPDGPPLLGPTPIGRLFLNLGHGSTGWAMSLGSGRVVADLVTGGTPAIDIDGLTLARYR